jgi:hypothetical protein
VYVQRREKFLKALSSSFGSLFPFVAIFGSNRRSAGPAMSGTITGDGSEDVNDFLKRIKELGDKRDKEDEERTRKLEEEIMQGRKEREARRAGTSIGKACR